MKFISSVEGFCQRFTRISLWSGAFSGYVSTKDQSLGVPNRLGTFASNFITLAEVRPLSIGSGSFSDKVPQLVTTSITETASGAPASRRATMAGTAYRVWQDDVALVSPVATLSGTMVQVSYGSGVLNSLVATVNRLASTGGGNIQPQPSIVWGGAIHRPYLRINQIDVDVDAREINIGLSAYSNVDIQVSEGANASVG